jgi:ABC-type amino acid transport substrate-binding protein
MTKRLSRKGLGAGRVLVGVLLLAACATPRDPAPTPRDTRGPVLRVAVSPNSPPYAFIEEGQLVGLEIDFARELAAALGRPLEVVETEWTDLIPVVRSGHADVIMAGMTITRSRQAQIGFSDPYLRSGLLAVMRREDATRFETARNVLSTSEPVGVVQGTTAERFVRERAPGATVTVYPTAQAAMDELRTRRVRLVVHDAAVAIWFVAADEANLAVLLTPLNDEPLGWGLPQGDEGLRGAVNEVLARWRVDGTRDRILAQWVPYWQRLEARSGGR